VEENEHLKLITKHTLNGNIIASCLA